MPIESVVTDSVLGKVSSAISDLRQDVQFVNIDGTKWQMQVSFDIADVSNSVEREMLAILLKYV